MQAVPAAAAGNQQSWVNVGRAEGREGGSADQQSPSSDLSALCHPPLPWCSDSLIVFQTQVVVRFTGECTQTTLPGAADPQLLPCATALSRRRCGRCLLPLPPAPACFSACRPGVFASRLAVMPAIGPFGRRDQRAFIYFFGCAARPGRRTLCAAAAH